MTWGEVILSIAYFTLSVVFLVSNIFGVPGNALIFLATLGYKLVLGSDQFGWLPLGIVLALFVAGEVLESYLGLRGAKRAGVSRKGLVASFIGAILGSILFAPFLFGVGAIIGAALGAFTGAFVFTLVEERRLGKAVEGGVESAKGRLLGTAVKGVLGLSMILLSAYVVIT